MQLTNIHSDRKNVYLFNRQDDGSLNIEQDNSFFPYYFEPCEEGNCRGYDGVPLKRLYTSLPQEIRKRASPNAYEADIIFCLDPDTYIKMANGIIKKLKDIKKGDKLISYNFRGDFTTTTVTDKWLTNKIGKTVETKSDTIVGSDNHLLLTYNFDRKPSQSKFDWKKIKNFKKGDYLIQWLNYERTPNLIIFDNYQYLKGFYMGDGSHFSDKRNDLEIRDKDRDNLDFIQNILIKYNLKSKLSKDKHQESWLLHWNSNNLMDIKSRKLIENISLESKLSYIAGFFDAEGTVGNSFCRFTNTNQEVLKWISSVLFSIGIPNKYRLLTETLVNKNAYFLDVYNLQKFKQLIPIKSVKKIIKLDQKIIEKENSKSKNISKFDVLPMVSILKLFAYYGKLSGKGWRSKRKYFNKTKDMGSFFKNLEFPKRLNGLKNTISRPLAIKIYEEIKNKSLEKGYNWTYLNKQILFFLNHVYFSKIKKISNVNQNFIDISVDSKNFIANNFASHNCKRYMIDKVKELSPVKLRWQMFDMETLSKSLPKPKETHQAKDKISCITLYDNLTDQYRQWYLGDFENESDLWFAFINYVKTNPPDLLLAWNMNGFDFPYLYHRIADFCKRISPIGQDRYGNKDFQFPAGISIIDYMEWWKKFTLNKEDSYALGSVMGKHLGWDKGEFTEIDFSKLSPDIKSRNMIDVKGMVELEKKKQLIPHFDMIRRLTKVEFEDLIWNSRMIDSLLLQEAKNQNVALPMRPVKSDYEEEDDDFEGAFREAFKTGAFFNIGKYDVSGAYCYPIIDLCLDSINIVDQLEDNCIEIDVNDRLTQEKVASYYVKQNDKALLPIVVKKLVEEKNKLKEIKNKLDPISKEYEEIEKRYEAFKTIVLSAWGVIGNKYFRRYDKRVASMITSIVRDLLHYIHTELEKLGYQVLYIDTDSVFCDDKGENIVDLLNGLIKTWALKTFNKELSVKFDYEGHFKKLFIMAKTRYLGYLDTGHGVKKEIKGIEAKRKDSTAWMKVFQRELLEKILNKETKESIFEWIHEQIVSIKESPLEDIAIPCSINKKISSYKVNTKPIQALENSPGYNKEIGDRFYWIYVEPEYDISEEEVTEYYRKVPGKREGTLKQEKLKVGEIRDLLLNNQLDKMLSEEDIFKKTSIKKVKKARNVMAFDKNHKTHLKTIDWKMMINRNILMKLTTIFTAMGWEENLKDFKN